MLTIDTHQNIIKKKRNKTNKKKEVMLMVYISSTFPKSNEEEEKLFLVCQRGYFPKRNNKKRKKKYWIIAFVILQLNPIGILTERKVLYPILFSHKEIKNRIKHLVCMNIYASKSTNHPLTLWNLFYEINNIYNRERERERERW